MQTEQLEVKHYTFLEQELGIKKAQVLAAAQEGFEASAGFLDMLITKEAELKDPMLTEIIDILCGPYEPYLLPPGSVYDAESAHGLSIYNKDLLSRSTVCGCFYCKQVFHPDEITDWIDRKDCTAVCPHCGIDSVVGDYPNLTITDSFLEEMNLRWFG